MRRNPLCEQCKREGLTVASAELDHIVPVFYGIEYFWKQDNWQALCRDCHIKKTRMDVKALPSRKYKGCDDEGNPIDDQSQQAKDTDEDGRRSDRSLSERFLSGSEGGVERA